jgi:hypothetical protein
MAVAFLVVLGLLLASVCVYEWVVFNLVRITRPTGDPQVDEHLGIVAAAYIVLRVAPAAAVMYALAVAVVVLGALAYA